MTTRTDTQHADADTAALVRERIASRLREIVNEELERLSAADDPFGPGYRDGMIQAVAYDLARTACDEAITRYTTGRARSRTAAASATRAARLI